MEIIRKTKKVLIACEQSASLRCAFKDIGIFAMSVDLQETAIPGPHYVGDVFDIIDEGWDMMIGFPPCQYLCKAQMWRYSVESGRLEKALEAMDMFERLLGCDIPHVALENPSGLLNTAFRQSDQLVRPWFFGDPYDKEINFWYKNMPPLMATCYNTLRKNINNHTNGRMTTAQRTQIKSSWRYYPLMCQAIACQWSTVL
jgi:hypothetical protein